MSAGCQPGQTKNPSDADRIVADVHEDARFTARLRIFDSEGNERTLPSVLDELAAADVVFFGETHLDEATHTLEQAIFDGIAKRREGKVALSLEMFERDVQPVVDEYVSGKIDEARFLERARPWPNYRTDYRPLVLAAKTAGAPVIAANTPRPLMRELGGQGEQGFAKVKAEHPEQIPKEMFPPSEAYIERVEKALRGHGPGMGGGNATWTVQNYWDNTMGESVADARARWPDRAVVHYAGGFHVAYRDGTVAQFARRRPDDVIKTIMAVPTSDLAAVKPERGHADFVAFLRADAQGPDSGRLAVTVPGELQWLLWLPETAVGDTSVPLLVFLPAADERPRDALTRWRRALGGAAAIAVIEPPHRQQSALGWIERRWSFPGSFASDVHPVAAGLPRMIAYARQHLPIDPTRITVVGEGAGGAVALWAALYGDTLDTHVVALSPELPHALRTAALPDDPSAVKSVSVVYVGEAPAGLPDVVAGLSEVGLTARNLQLPAGDPSTDRQWIAMLADKLGVPSRTIDASHPEILVAGGLEPHGRAWARLLATRWESDGRATELVASSQSPAAVALGAGVPDASVWIAEALHGSALPRPEASFGGGTVVVIPSGMPKRVHDAWTATIQASEAARGRFSPIHLVTEGAGELRAAALAVKEKGWSDVLVVPAVFAAHEALMKRLQKEVGELPDDLTVQWLPGLGAAVADADPKSAAAAAVP